MAQTTIAIVEITLDKLKKEVELLQRLNHPSIVKCLWYSVEDYRGYVIMEYIDGESLKEMVTNLGPLTEEQVVEIGIKCCDISDYLHSCDPPIIHRDITRDNIFRELCGEIKPVDFNVAHQLEGNDTATMVGKPCYLSPAIDDVIAKATCPKLGGQYEKARVMRKKLGAIAEQ